MAGVSKKQTQIDKIRNVYLQRWARSTVEHYEFDNVGFAQIEGYEYYAGLAQNIQKHGFERFNGFLADLQVWGTPDQVTEKLLEYVERTDAGGLVVPCASAACRPRRPRPASSSSPPRSCRSCGATTSAATSASPTTRLGGGRLTGASCRLTDAPPATGASASSPARAEASAGPRRSPRRRGRLVGGERRRPEAVDEAVAAVRAAAGRAVGCVADASTANGADALVATAVGRWGRLDAVVNNAGIARDRMLVNIAEADWDEVCGSTSRSTFLLTQRAARHWRDRSKAGEAVNARVVNTVSSVGLYGHVGQANYAAAKGAIARFTLIAAMELARYGVTVNAVCPTALTPMTEAVGLGDTDEAREGRSTPGGCRPPWCGWPRPCRPTSPGGSSSPRACGWRSPKGGAAARPARRSTTPQRSTQPSVPSSLPPPPTPTSRVTSPRRYGRERASLGRRRGRCAAGRAHDTRHVAAAPGPGSAGA